MNSDCEQYTHKYSTYRVAHSMITFHHANTRGSRLRSCKAQECTSLCLKKKNCHPRVMSHSLPHLTLTTSISSLSPSSSTSPVFPTVSPSQTNTMNLNPNIYPANGPQQSGGSTQIQSLTGYEPKSVEVKDIGTEAISPEDLEPRRIELDRNFGTDPHQIHERFVRSSLTDDMEEFRKSWCRCVLLPVSHAFRI